MSDKVVQERKVSGFCKTEKQNNKNTLLLNRCSLFQQTLLHRQTVNTRGLRWLTKQQLCRMSYNNTKIVSSSLLYISFYLFFSHCSFFSWTHCLKVGRRSQQFDIFGNQNWEAQLARGCNGEASKARKQLPCPLLILCFGRLFTKPWTLILPN